MRAREVTADFHICEGCDKAEESERTVRTGAVSIIEGWQDVDGDWISSTDEYSSAYEAAEGQGLDEDDVSEASYLVCPNNHDSDDGWEIEAFSQAFVCGVCHVRYTSLRSAATCCEDKENN
jgi:hypothetical protein